VGRIRIVYPRSPTNLIECKKQTIKAEKVNGLHSYIVSGHKGEIVVELTQSPPSETMMGGPKVQGCA